MAYARHSRLELTNRLMDRAGDGGVFWTLVERANAINEAIRAWQSYTGEHTTEFHLPLTSGVYYNVPRQLISVQRVTWNDVDLQLSSEHELDMAYPGWEGQSGTPMRWAPIGLNMIAIHPAPTSGSLVVEGIQEAPIMVSDGDFIDMGDEQLSKILGYAAYYLAFKEGTGELEATQGGQVGLLEAGADVNGRIKMMNCYKSALGLDKDKSEMPSSGTAELGARLSQ